MDRFKQFVSSPRNLGIALVIAVMWAVGATGTAVDLSGKVIAAKATPVRLVPSATEAENSLKAAKYFGGLLAREAEFTRQKQCRSRLLKQILDFAAVSPEVRSAFLEACLDDVRGRQAARAKRDAPKK